MNDLYTPSILRTCLSSVNIVIPSHQTGVGKHCSLSVLLGQLIQHCIFEMSSTDQIHSDKWVLTAEALNEALPNMAPATKAIHADDFVSAHRGIAPGMHVAVNYRFARHPDQLVQGQNKDVSIFI